MNHLRPLFRAFLALLLFTAPSFAASVQPLSLRKQILHSDAIVRGSVLSTESYLSGGLIFSETKIDVTEVFHGESPGSFSLTYRGGEVGNIGETVTAAPSFQNDDDRIFFLVVEEKGSFRLSAGPSSAPSANAELLRQLHQRFPDSRKLSHPPRQIERRKAAAATTTAESSEKLLLPPRRMTSPDRGEPIGYFVDADFLPAGMSVEEALESVEQALSLWSDVSSVRFRFEGFVSFGESATDIVINDRRLRIQLHDAYHAISGSDVLGIGGQAFRSLAHFPDGGSGGRVYDTEFHEALRSYVVLSHTAKSMENLEIFNAVLAHEIGHAIGLAHSSEDKNETDPEKRDALMYWQVQAGGGAALGSWDLDAISQVHPLDPPPFGYDRVIRAVTAHNPLSDNQANQIRANGYSLHTDSESVTPILYSPTTHTGSFQLSGSELTFVPASASRGEELDPDASSYYDLVYIRYSDGTHLSPPVMVRVLALLFDSTGDGVPDRWMNEHFGSVFPTTGFSGPYDDPDGDGISNIHEFLAGTDPLDSFSKIRISDFSKTAIEWTARPYDLYEIESSTDLINWKWEKTVRPVTDFGHWSIGRSENEQRKFYRVIRVD